MIELICDFSINQEQQRGYSYETLMKKIEAARVKKLQARLHSLNSDKKKNDDDDGDSEDKTIQQQLKNDFKDQAEVVLHMFNVIKTMNLIDSQTGIQVLANYSLEKLITKGMMWSENLMLRNCVG